MRSSAEVAWSYFDLVNRDCLEEALETLNDSGTWWNIRTRATMPMAEFKDSMRQRMGSVRALFDLRCAIAERELVLLEMEGRLSLPTGGTLENVYCFIVTVSDGTILHVREYHDTKRVYEQMPELWNGGDPTSPD